MDLNCPSCGTHFVVPDNAIGEKGRKLKCAKCDHMWRQMPLTAAAPEPAPAPVAEPEPEPVSEPQPVTEPDPFDQDDFSSSRGSGDSLPLEMEPGTGEQDDDPFSSPATDDLDDPLSGFDFDAQPGTDDTGDDLSPTDLDDFLTADDDPIPDMFARPMDDAAPQRKKGSKATTIVAAAVVVATALGAAGYLLRDTIISAVPATQALYDILDFGNTALGAGLEFQDTVADRLMADNVDMLALRGFIANTSSTARDIPHLHMTLTDGTGAVVNETTESPPKSVLMPGETVGFHIQIANPSAAAREYKIDWIAPPDADTGAVDGPSTGH